MMASVTLVLTYGVAERPPEMDSTRASATRPGE